MSADFGTCRSCHAAVIWAKTRAGKTMPLDHEPREDGNFFVSLPVDVSAPIVAVPVNEQSTEAAGYRRDPTRSRFVSHFATCPNADQHRRPS